MKPWVPALALSLISCLTTTLYFFSTPDSLKATSAQNSASSWGYWGPPNADFNWCEPDYVDSAYVAETWNSLTSLLYIVPAFLGLINARAYLGEEKRFYVLLGSIALVGVGSTAFHATLLYPYQLMDELPMFYLVLTASFILLHRDGTKGALTSKVALVAALGITALLALTPKDSPLHTLGRGFLTLGFTFCFIYIFYSSCAVSSELLSLGTPGARGAAGDVSRLFEVAFGAFVFAILCWIVDIMRCGWLHTLPFYPQLHAVGWHVFGAAGIYPLFMVLVLNNQVRKGANVSVDWKTLGFKGGDDGKTD
jgi:dihydroceramidase